MEFVVDSFAEAYTKLHQALLTKGEIVAPRGHKTLEINNVAIVLTDPTHRLGYHPLRNFSLPFACSEACFIHIPVTEIKYVAFFNKRMFTFSDDGITWGGSYGARVSEYIADVAKKIKEDPSTRQAVLTIYRVGDLRTGSKDIPCTLSLQFLLRKKKLHLYTTMRSNDFYWGWPYDLFQFTTLQEAMAHTLGVEMGEYVHRVASFHVYSDRDRDFLENIKDMDDVQCPLPYDLSDMQALANYALKIKHTTPPRPEDDVYDPFTHIFRAFKFLKDTTPEKIDLSSVQWAVPFMLREKNDHDHK